MLTGFNTDIEHDGHVFHVQTQDKGTDDAVVETMVYLGGRILASVSTPYTDLISGSDLDHELPGRMKAQHLSLINKILSGRFGEAPERDLNDLVIDFLEKEIDDPLPDIDRRKQRLRTVLERLEEQIAREALRSERRAATPVRAPVAPVPRKRAPVWIHGVGAGLLLVAAVAFAPRIGRFSDPDAAPGLSRAAEPARTAAQPVAATPAPPEAPREQPEGESRPLRQAAAVPAMPSQVPSAAPLETTVETPPPLPPVAQAEPEPRGRQLPPVERRAAAPPSWTGKLVAYSDVDEHPEALSRRLPVYTRRASRQGHQGLVSLDLLIDEKGYVTQVKVLDRIPDSDLHEAAMDAATSWRFTPARKAGQDVKVWTTVDLEFSIWPDRTEVVRIRE